MEFSILGPLEVLIDGAPVAIGGRKEQAVLALLVVQANLPVSVDQIVDQLWGEAVPATGTKTVRSYISRLRKRLGDTGTITTSGSSYILGASPGSIDAGRFETLLETATELRSQGSHLLAADRLEEALSLWRGRALEGLEDHQFAHLEAARLESRRLEAIEARIDSDLHLGRHERLVSELEQLVSEHPLRERLWYSLMLALYRSERQADALRAYQDARRVLGDELGIEPSAELRQLEDAILLQDEAIATTETLREPRHNLPQPRASFVGREAELEQIGRLLDDYRCVTLTGVGGSGKTRLAIASARESLQSHARDARYVELAAITDPTTVADHVLLTFGEPGSHTDDVAGALVDFIGDRPILVVLDNCEHLIAGVAELADRLLDGCPNLAVLSTSREPLAIGGEAVFRVPPLSVPEPDADSAAIASCEAVQLLVVRIQTHHQEFAVDQSTSVSIAAVCRKLEGIPLALELAAARARTLSIDELAAQLEDSFELLTQGPRTAAPRQRTLTATIDWSYDLLSSEGRDTLRRLATFSGSWSLEAAHAVISTPNDASSDTVEKIGELMDKSLVESSADASRYRLLEPIRQYAFDRLVTAGDASDAGRRHRDFFLALATEESKLLRGSKQQEAWTSLEQEHDNLRTAIQWSLDNEAPTEALHLVAALGWFWLMRGYWRDAWRWLQRALDAGGEPEARARAILRVGCIEIVRVNIEPMLPLLDEAEATYRTLGDEEGLVWCTYYRGHAASHLNDGGAADMEDAIARFSAMGDEWAQAWATHHRAFVGEELTLEQACALITEARDSFESLGDLWCTAYSSFGLASVHLGLGNFADAQAVAIQGRELASSLGDRVWFAHATRVLAAAQYASDDIDEARQRFDEAIETFRLVGDDACLGQCLMYRSLIDLRDGRTASAKAYLIRAIDRRQRIKAQMGLAMCLVVVGLIAERMGDMAAAARYGLRGMHDVVADAVRSYQREIDTLQDLLSGEFSDEERAALLAATEGVSLEDLGEEASAWCERVEKTPAAEIS